MLADKEYHCFPSPFLSRNFKPLQAFLIEHKGKQERGMLTIAYGTPESSVVKNTEAKLGDF
jgi:hypothetical protein